MTGANVAKSLVVGKFVELLPATVFENRRRGLVNNDQKTLFQSRRLYGGNITHSACEKNAACCVFGFGLLHGLGFASVLEQFGLPTEQFLPAIVGLNDGVEFGQIPVIAIAFFVVGLWFRNRPWYRKRIRIPALVIIALIGPYWFVTRLL